jgi:4-amino-4-deoxy-L-arabinose transferase-like glycosyltransferase
VFSQLLAASVTYFLLAYFESKKALALSIIFCSTPIVGAMGITLWHDIPMTAGFLLFLGALRKMESGNKWDYLTLISGGILASFRYNGLPTLIVFIVLVIALSKNRRNLVGVLAILVTLSGLSVALNTAYKSDLNVQSDGFIDWMRYDISCYASNTNSDSFFESNFDGELNRNDWSSKSACTWFNDSTAFGVRTNSVNKAIPRAWLNLATTKPLFVLKTHLDRHKYLVPVPYSGLPNMPFIHTTIEFPNKDLNFTYPKVSEVLRIYPRIWNYFNFVFGYAGLWLSMLFFVAWRRKNFEILKLALLGLVLNSSLFVFASISDGRFTLPLLISAQIILLSVCLDWISQKVKNTKDSRR